jgi:CDP-glycerol glycerophosphotransferase (TagB/SpsB family)
MPVKRLNRDAPVARHQTDILLATSDLHAGHIADTWSLPRHRISVTGLPRNDLLVERPATSGSWPPGKRRILWLPTFRRSVVGEIRHDGESTGSPLEFGDLTLEDLSVAAGRIGAYVIVKTHPMTIAPQTEVKTSNAEIWTQQELRGRGTTLYRLLAETDVLVTDHSSVWIDFLLTGRPILFAIADLAEYSATRGHYFEPLPDWLPGPVVSDRSGLDAALERLLTDDRWSPDRKRALKVHHAHADGKSAKRAASIVCKWLG